METRKLTKTKCRIFHVHVSALMVISVLVRKTFEVDHFVNKFSSVS